jgi:hypothetical protein
MSALPAEVMVREGLDNPRVLFLARPFTRDELPTMMRRALRGTRPVREGSEVRPPGEI